jgi:hypothetical protein
MVSVLDLLTHLVSQHASLNRDMAVQFPNSVTCLNTEEHKMELQIIWKVQLTSVVKSTISNWYAISGRMPIARAKMAPAEPTILYSRALFSVRLSMYGCPCKIGKSKMHNTTPKDNISLKAANVLSSVINY